MPTPVNNTSGGTGTGGAPVGKNNSVKVSIKANVNLGKGSTAIHQLNDRIGNNSQNPAANRADNAIHHAEDRHQNKPDVSENKGNNGNHYGQLKYGNQGQPPKGNNNPTVNTPPFNPGTENQHPTTKIPTVNTPPIIQHPNQTNNPQHPNWNPPVIITTRTYNPNTPNGVLRNAVVEILRQNDIYLSRSVINNLVGNQNSHGNNKSLNIPVEIRQLVQSVASQLSNTLNNSNPPVQQFTRQVSTEISNQLQSQINSARNVLLYAAHPDAKHFSNLNIQERVFLAVELMFRHLPTDANLQQVSNREIYNGLMLARGLVSSNENTADIRKLVSFRSDVLPNNFSAAGLRDLGQLVKVLVTDAANAKTTVNLDLAVQKFIRILVANNELGVLLAAAALSKQAELGTISMNRTLALVQIYELISRLVLAGEAAMKAAAAKNGLKVNDSIGNVLNKTVNTEEKNALLGDLQTNNLHHNLKNFLEFNPAFVAERAVSSFINADDARHAQQLLTSHHTDEIEQWLSSGNHRFVKEIELDKPIGIVVERGAEDFFSASKARIVLVRDSSAQGWHFLKSFLVT